MVNVILNAVKNLWEVMSEVMRDSSAVPQDDRT